MELHEVLSVRSLTEGSFLVEVDITDTEGSRYTADYASVPGDEFGLAPMVRTAVEQWIADGKPVEPYVAPPPPVPQVISRRQFYQGLAITGKITKPEALAAIKTSTLPAALQAMLDAMTDEDAKFEADMLLSGAAEFDRGHPLVMVIAAAQGMSEQDVDDFWRLCAGL